MVSGEGTVEPCFTAEHIFVLPLWPWPPRYWKPSPLGERHSSEMWGNLDLDAFENVIKKSVSFFVAPLLCE